MFLLGVVLLELCSGLELKIGHMTFVKYSEPGETFACMDIASDRARREINPNLNFSFVHKIHDEVDIHLAIREFNELRTENKVHVVVAPYFAEEIEPVAKMAAAWDMLLLSYNAANEQFKDKKLYSTLARFSIDAIEMTEMMALVIRAHGWKRVAMITGATRSSDNAFRVAFTSAARSLGIDIVLDIRTDSVKNRTEMRQALEKVRTKTRVVVMRQGHIIRDNGYVLDVAHDMNMTGTDYAYLMPWTKPRYDRMPWELDIRNKAAIEALFARVIVLLPSGFYGETFGGWMKALAIITVPQYNITIDEMKNWVINLATQHDGIYLYAMAANECDKDPTCDLRSGTQMIKKLKSVNFSGVSGQVNLNDNADRQTEYNIQTYVDGRWVINMVSKYDKQSQKLIRKVDIDWKTTNEKPPPDSPPCGFSGEKCVEDNTVKIIIMVVFVAAIVCIGMAVWVRQRNRRFESLLLAKVWQIDPNDLVRYKGRTGFSMRSVRSLTSSGLGSEHEPEHKSAAQALWKGTSVSTFTLTMNTQVDINNRNDLLLLKDMKELQHENINMFIGIAFEKESMQIVWGYCQKESLDIIVHNDEIELDIHFSSSILQDTTRGLNYLHLSKLGCHGILSIGNCLVDSRWTVKLSDYGIQRVLEPLIKAESVEMPQQMNPTQTGMTYVPGTFGNIIYLELTELAPELLREYDESLGVSSLHGTIQSDVYALGMIIYQVLFRESAFASLPMDKNDIVAELKNPGSKPLRPEIPKDHKIKTALISTMKQCWDEMPDQRPTVEEIRKAIYNALPAKTNLVDHAVAMMESYAKNLENMIESRTMELVEERQRSDQLLNKMLPKFIADKLKQGVFVEPESFEAVTIMFTDVVGFTTICGKSTPLQVVQMMNNFYSQFDDYCEKFDVYKVETIGDAYMVASGLPIRNGNKHAAQIAQLALEFRHSMHSYGIGHLPEQRFKIRFGMHTGPVAAGVVGLSMPHYCLFGDTVNVAARMESNGLPMKIHLSQECRDLLVSDEDGGKFHVEQRGIIDIKGKGPTLTYWLEGMGGTIE